VTQAAGNRREAAVEEHRRRRSPAGAASVRSSDVLVVAGPKSDPVMVRDYLDNPGRVEDSLPAQLAVSSWKARRGVAGLIEKPRPAEPGGALAEWRQSLVLRGRDQIRV
jgi:hypothetical protein